MAKGQKNSGRELKKPKKKKDASAAPAATMKGILESPVSGKKKS